MIKVSRILTAKQDWDYEHQGNDVILIDSKGGNTKLLTGAAKDKFNTILNNIHDRPLGDYMKDEEELIRSYFKDH